MSVKIGAENEEIRKLARLLLDPATPARKAAESRLIGLVYERVVAGISYSLRTRHMRDTSDPGAIESELVKDFLKKLYGQSFLEHLKDSPKPLSLISTAASNSVTDYFRQNIVEERTRVRVTEDGEEVDPVDLLEDKGADALEALETVEDVALSVQLLEELEEDKRILLKVAYAHIISLTNEEVRNLAERRGIPEHALRDEIDKRCARIDERYDVFEREYTSLQYRRMRLERELYKVTRVIEEIDGEPADPDEALGSEDIQRMRSSMRNLKAARPGARSAYLASLLQRQQELAKKMHELRDKFSSGLPPQPDWTEVAFITGVLSPNATEKEIKMARNTVQVKLTRLRKHLAERFSRLDEPGSKDSV